MSRSVLVEALDALIAGLPRVVEMATQEERAAVVAWLRAEAKTVSASFARRGDDEDLLLDTAEDIERGEHRRKGGE